jgi:tetratricopeptide (TPR) repeat protein
MGNVLQNLGRHKDAIAAFQRALQIQRVSNGIYGLGQEPIIKEMITSYEALGDTEEAFNSYQQLQWVYSKTVRPGDPRMIAMLREKSQWHINAYQQNPGSNNLYHLANAHELLVAAIEGTGSQNSLQVIPLLEELASVNYKLADHGRRHPVGMKEGFTMTTGRTLEQDPLSESEILVVNSYRNGRIALEKIAIIRAQDPEADPRDKAEAIANLGDWYLLFGRRSAASQAYKQAWQTLSADPEKQVKMFGRPTILNTNPLFQGAEKSPPADQGSVVARLSISTNGKATVEELVEPSLEGNQAQQELIVRELTKARFRPKLVDGNMVASNDILVDLNLTR